MANVMPRTRLGAAQRETERLGMRWFMLIVILSIVIGIPFWLLISASDPERTRDAVNLQEQRIAERQGASALQAVRMPGVLSVVADMRGVVISVDIDWWNSLPGKEKQFVANAYMREILQGNSNIAVPIEVRAGERRVAISINNPMRMELLYDRPTMSAPTVPALGFRFSIGDRLVNVNNGAEVGIVVQTEEAHTFPNGKVGRAYVVRRPNGIEMALNAERLEEIARER